LLASVTDVPFNWNAQFNIKTTRSASSGNRSTDHQRHGKASADKMLAGVFVAGRDHLHPGEGAEFTTNTGGFGVEQTARWAFASGRMKARVAARMIHRDSGARILQQRR
jgi:hypothetical protein